MWYKSLPVLLAIGTWKCLMQTQDCFCSIRVLARAAFRSFGESPESCHIENPWDVLKSSLKAAEASWGQVLNVARGCLEQNLSPFRATSVTSQASRRFNVHRVSSELRPQGLMFKASNNARWTQVIHMCTNSNRKKCLFIYTINGFILLLLQCLRVMWVVGDVFEHDINGNFSWMSFLCGDKVVRFRSRELKGQGHCGFWNCNHTQPG